MFTTLDHLEHHIQQHQKKKLFGSFGKELKGFSIFFLIVFILNSVFVNAQLYQEAIMDIVTQFTGSTNTSLLRSFGANNNDTLLDQEFIEKKMQLDQITQTVNALSNKKSDDFISEDITNNSLQENLSSYNLDFNLLPPTDRIIIPKININAPLLQSSFNKHIDTIDKEDFDKDLFNGVVQYPTTPAAGM